MIAFLMNLGRIVLLLFQIAFEGAAATVRISRPYALPYLITIGAATGIMLVVPLGLILLKVIAGWAWPAYVAAFFGAFSVLALGLAYTPLAILVGALLILYHGATWSGTLSPLELGRRYVNKVLVALFVELLLGVYVILVPLDQSPGLFFVLLLLGAAIAIGSFLWGGFGSGRMFTRLAIAAVLVITGVLVLDARTGGKWTLFGASSKKTCVVDESRPLSTVKKLEGRAPLWLIIPEDMAGYKITRHDDVPGDIIVWFRRGDVRDTWRRDEPMPIERWGGMLPERIFGTGHITLTTYPYRCSYS